MEDAQIVGMFFDRDEDAISETKKKYSDYCSYIAGNLLCDERDVQECVSDVLLSAWNSIPPHRPENLKTYIGKLTRESAVDFLRRNSAGKRVSAEATTPLDELEEVIGDHGVEEALEKKELSRLISSFLRTLREEERNVFVRRYWYYDPVKEICRRYDIGQSKVLVTLKRTRDKLALYLKKEGYLI